MFAAVYITGRRMVRPGDDRDNSDRAAHSATRLVGRPTSVERARDTRTSATFLLLSKPRRNDGADKPPQQMPHSNSRSDARRGRDYPRSRRL